MAGGAHWWRMSPEERFVSQYIPEPNSGCWLWTGSVQKAGYGKAYFGGHHSSAHRLSWTLHRGPIPRGMSVLHKCDNRVCVNPEHLFVGTAKDNTDDMTRKGRARGRFRCGYDPRRQRAA